MFLGFGSLHLKTNSLAASSMTKHSCNIGANQIEKLAFYSDFEQQFTSED
jgi:hypothetical protein